MGKFNSFDPWLGEELNSEEYGASKKRKETESRHFDRKIAVMETGRSVCFGGGKGDAPDAPDYTAAALATAQGNADAARIAAKANRVSQYTPYGNLIYQQGGGMNQTAYNQAMQEYQNQLSRWQAAGGDAQQQYITQQTPGNVVVWNEADAPAGYVSSQTYLNPNYVAKPVAPNSQNYLMGDQDSWSATVQLSPAQQALLDQQNKVSLGLANLSNKGLGYVESMLSRPFDTSRLPAEQIAAGQTAQDAIMARLDPKFLQAEETLRTRLINQGVAPGTEAWANEMRGFTQAKNDAYTQAALQGMTIGQQARQQALQEQAFLRNEPLNTLNAVRTGAQVTNPTFTNVPQQQTTAGPDYMQAAQQNYNAALGDYNAKQAANNSLMGGLFSLGSAAMGSPWAGKVFGF